MLLGIDLGTSSVKALLLDPDGAVKGEGSAGYRVSAPQLGWAESDPVGWRAAATAAVRAAVGPRGDAVIAVGLAGQMHGVVLCRPDGEPLHPAIIWADTRSRAQLEAYRRLSLEQRRRLANPPAALLPPPTRRSPPPA